MNAKEYGWAVGMPIVAVYTLDQKTPIIRHATITKIGRRWVSFGERYAANRFDAETMQIDGGQYTSPGMVYASEDEYFASTARNNLWTYFRIGLPAQPPDHLTTERLREIAAEIMLEDGE